MPLLSRVLNPASKRKPPFRKQQPSLQYPCVQPAHNNHLATTSTSLSYSTTSTTQTRTPSSLLQRLPQNTTQAPPTISDLYPVFRYLLESRHPKRTHPRSKSPEIHACAGSN